MNNFRPQQEPSATAREAANGLRDYYVALVQSGFSEAQALQVLGVMLASALGANPPGAKP